MSASAAVRTAPHVLYGIGVLLLALNLRPVFSSLAAVLPEVLRSTGASALTGGLLTTVPVLCLGLFGPAGPALAARLGLERTLGLVMAVVALGTALRAFGTIPALLAGAAVAGGAIAVGNVLLPSLVKRDFHGQAALMTGCYSMAMCAGAAFGAGVTVPLTHATGGWPAALGAWAVPALVAGLAWTPFALRRTDAGTRPGPRPAGLWRDPLAWRVTIFMGTQSALAYVVFGWMAPILRARGFTAEGAGALTSMSILAQVAASLLTPWIATRGRDQRATAVALVGCAAAGLLGALFAPPVAIPLFAVLQGIGQGGLFAVAMVIIIARSPDPHVAAHLSGMAQGVGYVIAATGPLLVGLVVSLTGSYASTAFLFVAFAAVAAWAGAGAGRLGHVVPPSAVPPGIPRAAEE